MIVTDELYSRLVKQAKRFLQSYPTDDHEDVVQHVLLDALEKDWWGFESDEDQTAALMIRVKRQAWVHRRSEGRKSEGWARAVNDPTSRWYITPEEAEMLRRCESTRTEGE